MQRGYIFRSGGSWFLRYYEPALDGRKQSCKRLASVDDYPTKSSVRSLADKILSPINANQMQPESSIPIKQFIEEIYLPHVKTTLKASTYKDYKEDAYEKHFESRLNGLRLRDFRTVHGQKLIMAISSESPDVGHKTLQRLKSFLSGAFKHAKRLGYLDGQNPMTDVAVPGKPVKFKGDIYSVEEIEVMLISLPEPAKTIVGLAALTGLRHSEIRGLRWSDFDGENLKVQRAVWRTHVQAPKTESSENSVPILPLLQRALENHKARTKPGSEESYIFAGPRKGSPLNLANLVRRVIVPAFEKSKLKPVWKGWHAFRRGLGTTLYQMGIQPKVIAAILRHSDIGVTLDYYVKPPDEETRFAIEEMERCFPFGL